MNFDSKRITIQHTVTGSGKRLICADTTKTNSSARSLKLDPMVEKHLLSVKEKQSHMKKLMGNSYTDSGYICTWDDGRLISPEYASRKYKRLLQASNLPVYRLHDLRHSAASILIEDGRSLKQVGEYLGHTNPSTTNRYAHLTYASTADMVDAIGAKLFPSD